MKQIKYIVAPNKSVAEYVRLDYGLYHPVEVLNKVRHVQGRRFKAGEILYSSVPRSMYEDEDFWRVFPSRVDYDDAPRKGRKIEIIGRGFSFKNYFQSGTERWGVTLLGFNEHMHRVYLMDFEGAFRDPEVKTFIKGRMAQNLALTAYSSDYWQGIPQIQRYPIEAVCAFWGIEDFSKAYFNNTVPYMLAQIGMEHDTVSEVHFHGVDYSHTMEHYSVQRACTEYWIGRLEGLGIKIMINPASFLMNSNTKFMHEMGLMNEPFIGPYGYKQFYSAENAQKRHEAVVEQNRKLQEKE